MEDLDNGKIFRMKKGFCHLMPDRMVFTTNAKVAGITNENAVSTRITTRFFLLLLSALYFYMTYSSFQDGKYYFTVFFTVFFILNVISIIQSFQYTLANVIPKSSIKNVKFTKGLQYLTRSRFDITYTDELGKEKHRLILLPGSLTGGPQATDKALELMIEEGFIEAKQY
jgi:hypothetical protein